MLLQKPFESSSFDDNNVLLKSRQQNKLNVICMRLAENASLVSMGVNRTESTHKSKKAKAKQSKTEICISKSLKIKSRIRQNR